MALPQQSEVLAFKSVYGDPRGSNVALPSGVWESRNLTRFTFPFKMTYAGSPISSMRINKECVGDFARLFTLLNEAAKGNQTTLDHWGVSIFGGSYNYRLMRGMNVLSMHAFGCAIDLDPARNGLGDANPRFAEFPEVIKAFRASGLCWGGDWDGDGLMRNQTRHDGMHLQATLPIGGKPKILIPVTNPPPRVIPMQPGYRPVSFGLDATAPIEKKPIPSPEMAVAIEPVKPSKQPGLWSSLFGFIAAALKGRTP